jgi:hypothetical protein
VCSVELKTVPSDSASAWVPKSLYWNAAIMRFAIKLTFMTFSV